MNESPKSPLVNGRPRRTEPLRAVRLSKSELQTPIETSHKRGKLWKIAGKLAMATACVIPPADLALSDVTTAKVYQVAQDKISAHSNTLETGLELGTTGAFITAESLLLGQALSRNKKLRNTFEDFEAYSEEQRGKRGPVKKAAFWTVTRPFAALEWIGNKVEHMGEWASQRKSKIARTAGRVAIDAGQVNAVGTSTVIMQETMGGKPTPFRRQAYLSGLIAGSWLGGAEAVRQIYRHSPSFVQTPLAAFGKGFETVTSVNFTNPLETPVGTLAISSVVAGFAYMGWKIEEFRQQREQLLTVPHEQIQQAIEEHQHRYH